ncbi:MAG TPA: hypothetical protein VNO43_04510 [Candidatus Eisenbacteria bacterium]|nr:hypothetical protein [Candidatus Eisenbacteria bacterium]
MKQLKLFLFGMLAGISFLIAPFEAESAERRNACRRGERIRIQDLDVTPDPLIDSDRIRGWRVRLLFEGHRACETDIEIREGGEVIALERNYTLRPGINEMQLRPTERYRFERDEHCFRVVVDLEGTRREVDSDRKFCAYQRRAWSMRERGDGGRVR